MTLGDTLQRNLDGWKAQEKRTAMVVEDGANSAHITLDRVEALSCQIWELQVKRQHGLAAIDGLKSWSHRVASHATGLLEPLCLLEVDAARGHALLRSNCPSRVGEDRLYYELTLNQGGTGLLRRYQGSFRGDRRRQIGFVLTREALAKLLSDLLS